MGNGGSSLFSLAEKGDDNTLSSRLAQMSQQGTLQLEEKHPDFGYTLLHFTAREGHVESGRLLLMYGANTNATNNYGYTPLHLCALWNRVDFAKMLIEHGADLNSPDEQGDRPLHIAVREDHPKVALLLLESGADFMLKEDLGFLPLHFSKSEAMERVLLDYYKEGRELGSAPKKQEDVPGGEQKPVSFSEIEDQWSGSGGAVFSTPEVVLDFDADPDDGIKPDDSYDPNSLTTSDLSNASPLVGSTSSPLPHHNDHRNLFFTPPTSSERSKTMESQVTDQMAAFTLSSSGGPPLSSSGGSFSSSGGAVLPTASPRQNVTPPPQETFASPLSGSSEGGPPSEPSSTSKKLRAFISAPRGPSSLSFSSSGGTGKSLRIDKSPLSKSSPIAPGDAVGDDDL